MIRHLTLFAVAGATLVGACAGTNRFDGAPARGSTSAPFFQTPSPETASAPLLPVTSAPLSAPATTLPSGGSQISSLPGSAPTMDPLFTPSPSVASPVTTGSTPETPTLSGGASRVATLGERPSSGGRSGAVTSRDGVIGGWTAREATGGNCKVTLSSSPALDLYRASANGCANKELQKITAWDYRDGEVYLYQQGGAVAARMRVNDSSSLSGSIARSGAGLAMSR